jgi:hypothetical protein
MRILIPKSETDLGGPFVEADDDTFTVYADRDGAIILDFHELPDGVDWVEEFEFMYCREQHDAGTVKVIRRATSEELKQFRVPIWIQDEETPSCCGKQMRFVGQIDDDKLCTERPSDAKLWWHDAASFYVFTCSQCLECKAVGQQY